MSVVEMEPNNNTAYRYLGYYYLKLESVDKAIESYSRALKIDDMDWEAHNGLGVAYIFQGRRDDGTIDESYRAKAVEQWNISLRIRPDQPSADRLEKWIKSSLQ
ncbi:hypothetical protein ES703_96494 [subsurface metagenome]